jgi:DeoR/GlpR family transcriptional regulator of sugar metabolism
MDSAVTKTMVSNNRPKKPTRHRHIVAELTASPTVRTSDLARSLGVSTETVRRDIEELTQQGLVSRTYGGAASAHVGLQLEATEREAYFVEERKRIARLAVQLVRPGDVLMVDAGSTNTYFARALGVTTLDVTVITNGFSVASALAGRSRVRVIFCPGDVSEAERGVYGQETTAFLNRFHADVAFIGASGVTTEGPTDVETQACWIKRAMLERAERCVLLADSSKFQRKHFEIVCSWSQLTDFVTDAELPGPLARKLSGTALQTHIAR